MRTDSERRTYDVSLRDNKWVRLLAYVTGLVNQKLLLQNEYLAAENRILPLASASLSAFPIQSARPWLGRGSAAALAELGGTATGASRHVTPVLSQHRSRGEERLPERLPAIYPATPATQDAAVREAGARIAGGRVGCATLRGPIVVFEQRIEEFARSHPTALGWPLCPRLASRCSLLCLWPSERSAIATKVFTRYRATAG